MLPTPFIDALPIVQNRIAQFAARFERHGTAWVYYGDRLSGGFPVSDAERTMLLTDYERRLRRTERIMRWWLPIAVVACVTYVFAYGGGHLGSVWHYAPVLLLPLPWVFLEWWRADRMAMDLVGRRVAVTKPRSWWDGARSRIVALPASIGIMLVLVSALLAFQSRPWATGEQRLWLAEACAGVSAGAWLIWLRRRRR